MNKTHNIGDGDTPSDLTVFVVFSGPVTRTSPSAPRTAQASGSRPRTRSAGTTGFRPFSTSAPAAGAAARRWGARTSRPRTTRRSCPARSRCRASWRSSETTSVGAPTIRACWPPRSPVRRSWWRRPWRGEIRWLIESSAEGQVEQDQNRTGSSRENLWRDSATMSTNIKTSVWEIKRGASATTQPLSFNLDFQKENLRLLLRYFQDQWCSINPWQ